MKEDRCLIVSPVAIHRNAVVHGFYGGELNVPEKLALIHSEVSEALEAHRNSIPEGAKGCMSEELADVVIRVFDLSEALGLGIVEAVARKCEINKSRPWKHGKLY
ncbi:MAG: hypothetical protein AB7D57_07760 [Desulfovibrionaceae bacterium]